MESWNRFLRFKRLSNENCASMISIEISICLAEIDVPWKYHSALIVPTDHPFVSLV